MNEEAHYKEARLRMVAEQIEQRGLSSERSRRLIDAMRTVPRHCYVPDSQRRAAYQDGPLPIGHGQTISQPYIVALMTDQLELTGTERVLEVGTGSGYQAAILSLLAKEVHTLERIASLAENAAATLAQLGNANVYVHYADGSLGWQPAAPYAAILVAAAAPSVPQILLDQLTEGGRLVIPVGSYDGQTLQRWTRHGDTYESESIIRVSFVPLRGAAGWDDHEWLGKDDLF
jgi:protein-L-isoaspartate(D-aspartate) O-methyltransferase